MFSDYDSLSLPSLARLDLSDAKEQSAQELEKIYDYRVYFTLFFIIYILFRSLELVSLLFNRDSILDKFST